MLNQIIPYSFYLLFFLTPLFWTSLNYELFEYNKMILTYLLTTIITGTWVFKMIEQKKILLKRTPLDIPLILFLGANILSTIFSIDPHTSIFGYYSRSNGGLLSLIAYLLLYWAFVSNMDIPKLKNTLKVGLISGFLISVWAIFEHFGVSLSCVILRGEFNADCWIQDVQARVFASLGQPNWLAAYLAMLIFPAIYFLIISTTQKERLKYFISTLTLYLAFTFTYSRGPTLGLLAGMAVFLAFLLLPRKKESIKKVIQNPNLKYAVLVLAGFLLINVLFGSALTSFRLVSKFAAPTRPAISIPTTPSGTQLENGGTESGQIRFIVWQGALDIFKHFPLFGSGLETFAYSYYQFRPASHNLTSEWNFLYNKAHNEYLNYLSTTGIVGFGSYLLIIGYFVFWCSRFLITGKPANEKTIFVTALLASYISYLIYNFFLFSVVIIAIFFYIFPALAFVFTQTLKDVKKLPPVFNILASVFPIYRRPINTQITKGFVIFVTLIFLFLISKLWYADTIFNKGENASDSGNPGVAYNLLSLAVDINKVEPLYRSELAYSAAAAASSLQEIDATLSAQLKDEALSQMENTLKNSPRNVSIWRTAIRTYFELSTIDRTYINKTLDALDQAIKLAPTDPKLYYNKALILQTLNKDDEAVKVLQKAVELKPNYLDALEQLKEATSSAEE